VDDQASAAGVKHWSATQGGYYTFVKRGLEWPQPGGTLLAEPWIYQYGLLDKYAVTPSWTGQYAESHEACMKILASGHLPQDQLARVTDNARLCFRMVYPKR